MSGAREGEGGRVGGRDVGREEGLEEGREGGREEKPWTEEIGLQIITTAKISNKFSQESPYISNTISREPSKIQTSFHLSKWSPVTQ